MTSGESLAGDALRRSAARLRRRLANEFEGLLFLVAIAIVGAASAGSLFAAGLVLLRPAKPTASPAAPAPAPERPLTKATAPVGAPSAAAASPHPAEKPVPAAVAIKAPAAVEHKMRSPTAPVAPAATPATPAAPRPPVAGLLALEAGDASLGDGQISVARFYYERAVDAGDAEAALRIGETFDPAFLTERRLRWVRSDRAAAEFWYARAATLGATGARERLAYLASEPPTARSRVFRHRAAISEHLERPAKPSGVTFHQILERILHPPRG